MKRVVLVGYHEPFKPKGKNDEIWCVNYGFERQPDPDRLYLLGPLATFNEPGFLDRINALGCPVFMVGPDARVKRSERFPGREIIDGFFGGDPKRAYATSTVAWMWAHALLEGRADILVHQILMRRESVEYMLQKACLDYWLGVSQGLGVAVETSADSLIGKPHPWQSGLYGYTEPKNGEIADMILAQAIKAIETVPMPEQRHSNAFETGDGHAPDAT